MRNYSPNQRRRRKSKRRARLREKRAWIAVSMFVPFMANKNGDIYGELDRQTRKKMLKLLNEHAATLSKADVDRYMTAPVSMGTAGQILESHMENGVRVITDLKLVSVSMVSGED